MTTETDAFDASYVACLDDLSAVQAELARLRGAVETWRDELNMDERDVTNTNVIWRRVNRILDPEQETP